MTDFNIQFPDLVTDAHIIAKNKIKDFNMNEKDFCKELIMCGYITEDFKPTLKGLSSGILPRLVKFEDSELTEKFKKFIPECVAGDFILIDDYLEILDDIKEDEAEGYELFKILFRLEEINRIKEPQLLQKIATGEYKVVKNKDKQEKLMKYISKIFLKGFLPEHSGGGLVVEYKSGLRCYSPNEDPELNSPEDARVLDILKSL